MENTRTAFIDELTKLAIKDPNVILIVGDVGFSYADNFAQQLPEQFINCGVMEQTMMGVAAGLAKVGFKPYVYSMIPFVTMRCYEQLRNDVCYHDLNVKVIGVRGSVHYKFLGFSHNLQGAENETDLLKNLPNLQIFLPETEQDVHRAMQSSYLLTQPTYIRL